MQGMKFCSPCNLFTMLNKMLWLLCFPAVHSASAEEDRFFFFFPRSDWLLKCYLCVWEDHPKWLCILLSRNNSEGIIYKSKLKWKKKCSHLLAVVWFIIYTCTGIRWVSLCVMSHQGCNICLAGFKDVTPPPPGSLQAMCATDQALFQELIGSREQKKWLRCKILLYLRGRLKIESHLFSSWSPMS